MKYRIERLRKNNERKRVIWEMTQRKTMDIEERNAQMI